MSILGVIAFITGTLGVWLTIKQNVLCWPAALISVCAATIDFFQARLYGDMSLQIFYFFAGLYGWYFWHKNKTNDFKVSRTPVRWWAYLAAASLLQFAVYYFLLIHYKGARPMLDAVLTALSLTTTYMMTRKWVENWALWVFIDGSYILLYILTDLWLYALLYLVFTAVALYGWIKWKKLA
jgi:nicotinamide mononucleotide transporter